VPGSTIGELIDVATVRSPFLIRTVCVRGGRRYRVPPIGTWV